MNRTLSNAALLGCEGSVIDVVSTAPAESTTNCAHVVPGGVLPMMPRIGIDSEPLSVTP
jgi:hypothetical protein